MAARFKERSSFHDDDGATSIEYAVIIFIVGLAIGVGASLMGASLSDLHGVVADKIEQGTEKGGAIK